jgi:signal transduction histidine kinase
MVRSPQRRRPSFFWQPLLILFPVAVLAALGFLSLRQDKTIAQHEAIERAQGIADSLLPRLWSVITNADQPEAFEHNAFQVDAAGELLFPPPVSLTPSPEPLNANELTAEQSRLWEEAERAQVSDQRIPEPIQIVRKFLETKPPERFAAVATYNLAILLAKQGQSLAAADTLLSLLDKYPHAAAGSGLPLDRLAEFKLLELSITMTNALPANVHISSDDFCRHIVFDPSPLASPFLSWITAHAEALGLKDGNDYWNSIWQEHEESRNLFANAGRNFIYRNDSPSASPRTNALRTFWFSSDDQDWLAMRFDEAPYSTETMAYRNAATPLKTHESAARLRAKMDLQPTRDKNRLMNPFPADDQPRIQTSHTTGSSESKSIYGGGVPQRNLMSPEISEPTPPSNTTRQTESGKVTLNNESARLEPSHPTTITIARSRRTAEQNGVSLPDFSGPAEIPTTKAANSWFLCRTEAELSQVLFSLVRASAQAPEYFGVGIEVAGKRLREAASDLRVWREVGFFEGGGSTGRKIYLPTIATNVLASAFYSDNGNDLLKVSIYLTSPATVFRRQSDRTFWFGLLVAISTLAAFIGLFSAWRAFNRQQELAEMKSNFVSSVSHELRAPIASVRLMAESLERGKVADPPKQHEYFRFIGQECRRLSSLIENVLDFSRIEQGRKQYEFEPTDLRALLQQTVKLMEAYGIEKQVSIVLKLPDHQPSTFDYQLSLDGRAIQQALINLLDNAIKHSPSGQTVSVVLESPALITHLPSEALLAKEDHAALVQISVIDHGPGIPLEEHEKIFERFYRLGSELRRETQGVGIGLSIVKHIVEAHHGYVLVQSAPGKGSRFTIELPMVRS